jgi:AraC-like DNA-binding protein
MTMASAPRVVVEGGGGPERADVVCGFLGCDVRPFNPVLASLPRLVHLRRTSAVKDPDRLTQLMDFALAESRDGTPGAKCVLLHVSEILFVEVVRRYLETLTSGHTGWLAGLRDPLVGQALARLHDRPAESWTLERLAREVGASRSALADRFTHLVGQPPMRYLTCWRLQLAAGMLADGAAKVSAVAREVGYESEAAFSRAFKKSAGASPAAWRRHLPQPT